MITPTNPKSYDKVRLTQLKEVYYTALGRELSARENPKLPAASFASERRVAEDALIDFADELLSDDSKVQTLLRQRRLDMKTQLVELILRLSTE